MHIHKKTYEVLEGVIPKGTDWLEIPKDVELVFTNDSEDDDCLVFAKELRGEVFVRVGEIKWEDSIWKDLEDLGGCDSNRTIWKKINTPPKTDLESTPFNPLDVQEGGSHYKDRGIQPVEYTEANKLNFQQGNVVKYITRHKEKNGVEDLGKVVHYALLEAYFAYGIEGSTKLKEKILKMLGEDNE